MSQFLGHNYIGGQRSAKGSIKLHSVDAASGETLPQDFFQATPEEVDAAAQAAATAYPAYRALSAARRAQFLDAIADELDARSHTFVELVCRGSGLPPAGI
ncbi:aldehyde dehydrogenase family protein, partial [Pseudomonas sp. UBA4034]|uniref:aldehyde dehydrogenase family protein n=1 Tax=Pseudomonas sp. UBA4034 TaxID=1947315 RepID=UPI00258104AD